MRKVSTEDEGSKDDHHLQKDDEFIVEQKFFSLGKKYFIKDDERNQVGYCERESLFKEGLAVYKDRSKEEELFRIKQKSLTKFTGLFEVLGPDKETIGYLKRNGFKSIVRDEWTILDSEKNNIGSAKSDYLLKDLIRMRYLKFIPYRYQLYQGEKKIGIYKQRLTLLKNSYKLQIKYNLDQKLDKRLLISLAICLDAVEEKYRKFKYRKVF
ncbi:MAG: hypothetical protein V5A88_04880 [Candidatus Thermoplasmatota archaeon]